jgi:hypothetical protein
VRIAGVVADANVLLSAVVGKAAPETTAQSYLRPGQLRKELAEEEVYAPGDAQKDGFDESQGCYFLAARQNRCRFTLAPPEGGVVDPVFRVAGEFQAGASASSEGLAVRDVVSLEDGSVLLILPGRVVRATTVEVVGKPFDKTNRVGEEHLPTSGQGHAPRGRVERGKELILGQDAGAGEGIEERGLAGVGIADQRHCGDAFLAAALAVQPALHTHFLQLALQMRDAAADSLSVYFELRLAGAAQADSAPGPATASRAACLSPQVRPGAGQPGQAVLVLRQLDLQGPFAGAGVLGKDIQDQACSIKDEYPAAQGLLQFPLVAGGEFVIEDDNVCQRLFCQGFQFLHLTGADEGLNVGMFQLLCE